MHFTFSISPPTSIANLLGFWLNAVDAKTKARIRIGVAGLSYGLFRIVGMPLFLTMPIIPIFAGYK